MGSWAKEIERNWQHPSVCLISNTSLKSSQALSTRAPEHGLVEWPVGAQMLTDKLEMVAATAATGRVGSLLKGTKYFRERFESSPVTTRPVL